MARVVTPAPDQIRVSTTLVKTARTRTDQLSVASPLTMAKEEALRSVASEQEVRSAPLLVFRVEAMAAEVIVHPVPSLLQAEEAASLAQAEEAESALAFVSCLCLRWQGEADWSYRAEETATPTFKVYRLSSEATLSARRRSSSNTFCHSALL